MCAIVDGQNLIFGREIHEPVNFSLLLETLTNDHKESKMNVLNLMTINKPVLDIKSWAQ